MTDRDSARPPAWLPRAVLIIALTLVGLTFLGWFFYTLRSLFGMLFVALFLAIAVEPVIQRLAKRGMARSRAALLVMTGFVILLAVIVLLVVPALIGNIVEFIGNVPDYVASLVDWADQYVDLSEFDPSTIDYGSVGAIAGGLVGAIFSWGAGFFGAIGQVITILLFAYYLVAQGPQIRRGVLSFLTPERQREANYVWEVSVEKTGSYFYSRLILGLLNGTYSFIVFLILGLPYAFSMAVFVGVVSQLIPVVGTYIAMFVPAIVAFFDEPIKALWVIIFLTAYQGLENLVLLPRVTHKTMEIHPAVSIAAVIAGGALFGPIGIFLSLPVTAVIQSVISTYINRYELIPELVPKHADEDPAPPKEKGGEWWRFWEREEDEPGPAGDEPSPAGDEPSPVDEPSPPPPEGPPGR
jgi:predicted PurR-regulated permease PerM